MHPLLLRLYHSLPGGPRSVLASLRGYQLRAWRYGPETDRLVAEALDREHWGPDHWRSYQQEHLARMLHRAATRVPYYREQWQGRRRAGDRSSWECVENWPVLDKQAVREQPAAFLADDRDQRRLFHVQTSGTTGTPLHVWQSRKTLHAWYALFEARWRNWNGVDRHDRWAILGGQLIAPVRRRKPPFWVWNRGLNQLYLSSYHLAPDLIRYYLDAMDRHRITYLWGYTSALCSLANALPEGGWAGLKIKVVLTNAEPVHPYQRDIIAARFRCPVRETYGMTEMIAGAAECERGGLHLWPEAGFVEVIANGQAQSADGAGDLVSTGLINDDMLFVRYRVGDRIRMAPPGSQCGCGRTLPLLSSVAGRSDDVLYTHDGRQVGRLDPVFKGDLPVREVQIIQKSLDRVLVKLVPSSGYDHRAEASLKARMHEYLGDIEIDCQAVDAIPRGPNGKFRSVVCELSETDRRAAGAHSFVR